MNTAFQKTEKIKTIFLDTQSFYETHGENMPALVEYLTNAEPEFSSIAYESASMAIALKNFETGSFPDDWLSFANGAASVHKVQVYVGLGWAIAKLQLPFFSTVKDLDQRLYSRIADGCGYYDGSFRKRQTVLSQQLPVYIPETAIPAYDQGVGRSLWYSYQADIDQVRPKIESFSPARQPNLWRGIGIAVAYVGGCDDACLTALFKHAGANGFQLACGAALAARSRMQANTMTEDTDRCSRLWFILTAGEANTFSPRTVDHADIDNEEAYINWMKEIEEGLANSFKIETNL